MKKLLFSVVFILVLSAVKSQQWKDVTPAGYTGAFFSTRSFINEMEGWVFARPNISSNYDLLHTSDGAQSFEKLISLTNSMECWKLQMIDSLYGYAKIENGAAYENYFWKTTDGGHTWQDITDTALFNLGNPLYSCFAFYFTTRDTGFFGGLKSIYKSLDGGISWQQMNAPQIIDSTAIGRSYRPNSIYFIDNLYGWAACSLFIDGGFGMKTIDGGESWAVCTPLTGDLYDIHFANNLKGGMAGNGTFFSALLMTEDNFQTEPTYFYPWPLYPSTICYQNESTIWCSGSPPVIKRSSNGGLTFEDFDTSYAAAHENGLIMDIQFFGNTGYAFANISLLKLVDTLNTATSIVSIAENEILVSPNPFTDKCKVTVSMQKPYFTSFEIFNADGILVGTKDKFLEAGKNDIILDLHYLKPGLYLLQVKSENRIITQKIIKQ
jgi:photosystem II stability/assembly factor-like uncharacterized protein